MDKRKESSTQDVEYTRLLSEIQSSAVNLNVTDLKVDEKGLSWFKDRLYIPNIA